MMRPPIAYVSALSVIPEAGKKSYLMHVTSAMPAHKQGHEAPFYVVAAQSGRGAMQLLSRGGPLFTYALPLFCCHPCDHLPSGLTPAD